MKRAENRMRKMQQSQKGANMGRYTNGSCITDMQLELKKEIEHAEIDEGYLGTIKLDFNVAQQ